MNGDVQYDLTGGQVSFDTLYRLDQLAATLHGSDGWQIRVEVDPGIVLTATPAREPDSLAWDLDAPVRPSEAPLAPERAQNTPAQGRTAPMPSQGGTA